MNPLEWARRRSGVAHPERALDLLRDGDRAGVETRTGLGLAWIEGVRSFYDLLPSGPSRRICTGTACAFGGAPTIDERTARPAACLGRCYAAPADSAIAAPPIPYRSLVSEPIVLRHLLAHGDAHASPCADYALPDGDTILARVTASGLRGRGGAAYPTGAKWTIARDTPAPERYVVANGDEGDPGAFVDRLLLEETPHAVLAGMLACARAIGAGRGVVYVRGEYPEAAMRVQAAIDEAKAAGLLQGFHVEVVRGAGSYVAGEETALLRSIEGLRAEPSPKPPYPAQCGLHGLPTIVQNVETFSVVPWIVANARRADTKAICLSGAIARPGVVEVALGTALRRVLMEGGGGAPPRRPWKMALVGGPMGRVIAEPGFDVALSWEALPGLGHGGIVVFDEAVSPRALAEHLYRFAASESCGSCTPCRVGSAQLAPLARMRQRAPFERLLDTLEHGSLCGFGQGVPRPLRDLLELFGAETFA